MRGGNWFTPRSLGSASTITDGSGTWLQRYDYAPFGQVTVNVGSGAAQPFNFTGREADETGLMYYRARYYSPGWGRFVSEDPLGFKGGINPYTYCDNNPVNRTDPTGKMAAAAALLLVPVETVLVPLAVATVVTVGVVVAIDYFSQPHNPTPSRRPPGRGPRPPRAQNPPGLPGAPNAPPGTGSGPFNPQGLPQPNPNVPSGEGMIPDGDLFGPPPDNPEAAWPTNPTQPAPL